MTKRKTTLSAVLSIIVAGLTLVALTRWPQKPEVTAPPQQSAPPASAEAPGQTADSSCTNATTIRNATDREISYTIGPEGRPEAFQFRSIAPKAVDCFPTAASLEIRFRRGEKEVTYTLDPRRPYAFRYDGGANIELFWGSHGRTDAVDLAPYVPTPEAVVNTMLELAGVTAKDVVFDIGCGDGRIVIAAAKEYGARGVGIDLDQARIDESQANARRAGVENLVKFICMDATRADISEATVVTLYLIAESNALLRPVLEKQLRAGSRVVSHNYAIAGWEDRQVSATRMKDEEGKDHSIYVYAR